MSLPLYEYECPTCENKFEKIKPVYNRLLTNCPKCGKPAEKVMSKAHFSFGWRLTDASQERFGPRDEYERDV